MAAFAHIYDLTATLVYAQLVALHVDGAEARLQEAYLQYWRQLPGLVQHRSLSSVVVWLVGAATQTQRGLRSVDD